MRHSPKLILSILVGLAVTFAALGIGVHPAWAQQYPASSGPAIPLPSAPPPTLASGLQVTVTPYLWLANVNAAITTPLERAPVVNTSVGAFQLLGHLDGVPFAGAAEVRDGPFSLLGDVLHFPIGTNVTTRNVFYQGGSASLTENIGTALFLYHAIEQPVQSIDGGVGFRAWGVSSRLTLNPGLLPGANVTRSAGWGDPLIAARYYRDFGNGFGLTAYGDVGGFGVAAHVDWQVIGTLDYALKPWVALRIGYRSLNVSTSGSVLGYNIHMKGPILAASFRF
jgi:hypothetical protein